MPCGSIGESHFRQAASRAHWRLLEAIDGPAVASCDAARAAAGSANRTN